ncbi:MAG: diguanylate cyclase [Candidatus Omnitrophota bacterium]|nr:MAG: diguanylate cyclase [Candidatus Omnitrophota bacterium]
MPDIPSIDYKKLPLSLIDDLTQLCNRRFIYNNMPDIIAQDKTAAGKASLLMIDVDNFKNINDTFGHLAGDKVLVELAKRLDKYVSKKGIVARYAGDEFVILFPGQDEKQAYKLGEAMLQDISGLEWPIKDKNFEGLGLSIGVAAYPADSASLIDLIRCADEALYAAKNTGKNRILVYKSIDKEIKDRIRLRQVFLRPPFIDREKELEGLKKDYKTSQAGKRKALLVEGESGIGKTRLLEEFSVSAERQDTFLLFRKLGQRGEGGPLAGLAKLLHLVVNSFGLNKFGAILSELKDSELAEVLYIYPMFKKLAKDVSPATKPEGRAADLFSGLCKIMLKVTREKTLVLIVDNLHYANQLTLQFFSVLLGISKLNKFLFIGTYDKKAIEKTLRDFLAKGLFTTIKLEPLAKDEVTQLIESIFPGIKPEPKLVENLYKASKGNPLLLGEILKTLVENGSMQYKNKQWQSKAIGAGDIPASLRDTVEPRIDRLDDETKEMLSYVAVMGGKVELDILKKFSGYNEGRLFELLDRAINAGVIKLSDLKSYDSVSFQAGPARETLAKMIPAQKAAGLNQRLAELIKDHYKDELPVQLDRLIRHFELGMDKATALKYKNIAREIGQSFALSKRVRSLLEKIERQEEIPVSIEELLERPLSEASAKIIKDVVSAVRAAIVGALLYPAGNKMRSDLQDKAYEMILDVLRKDPTLTFTDAEDKLLINGSEPKQWDTKSAIGFAFISLMRDYNISSITFKHGLGKQEFTYFLHCIATPEEEVKNQGGLVALFEKGSIAHIKVDEVKYEKLSKLTERAIGIKGIKQQETFSTSQLSKGNLLDMPVEQYFDPKILGKLDLIIEAFLLNKKDAKVEKITNKLSENLDTTDAADKTTIAEGAVQLSKSLLKYEKFHLLETLTGSLINRSRRAKQPKEFAELSAGLQMIANRLIGKENFGQARTIIKHFKEQIEPDSAYTEQQKKVVEEEFQKIAHPKVTEALVNALKQKLDSSSYRNITEILAELGGYALNSLLKLLTEEEAPKKDAFDLYVMRHSVATILKKIGQPAKDALKEMLSDNRPYVVKNVIEVLGYIGGEDVVKILAPCFQGTSTQVRMQCVLSLKKIHTKEALKSLLELLKDSDGSIRQAASLAIAEIADPSFEKELAPLLANRSTKSIAEKTIQKIRAKKKK